VPLLVARAIIRLANIGGRGPVARQPRDPASLSIIIEPDHI